VRYLTLAEALIIAEAVTGIDAVVLARASRVELLDSARPAPQAGGRGRGDDEGDCGGRDREAGVARWLGAYLGRNT
jgi:hypothetical protein